MGVKCRRLTTLALQRNHPTALRRGTKKAPFANSLSTQATPLYLSEMAPHKARGSLNIMFQLAITVGILAAQVRQIELEVPHLPVIKLLILMEPV